MPPVTPRIFALLLLVFACTNLTVARAQDDPTSADLGRAVAETYGFAHWDQIEEIKYTFNTQSSKGHNARSWTWRPIEGRVTLEVEGQEPVSYLLSEINDDTPEELRKIDHRFINDSYWLLYPFQLVWSGCTVTDAGEAPLPIGEGTGRKLITQYPDEGGYTPGDAYDIYLDDAGLIVQWDFRKGGGDQSRPMTWENNIRLGPITVCTDHHNADKSFRLWFDGLSVMTADGEVFEGK